VYNATEQQFYISYTRMTTVRYQLGPRKFPLFDLDWLKFHLFLQDWLKGARFKLLVELGKNIGVLVCRDIKLLFCVEASYKTKSPKNLHSNIN